MKKYILWPLLIIIFSAISFGVGIGIAQIVHSYNKKTTKSIEQPKVSAISTKESSAEKETPEVETEPVSTE